jgi:hypothetical protein
MGMSESPPPTVIQLRETLERLRARIDDGTTKMILRGLTGNALALTKNLIEMYPALTTAADGTRWEDLHEEGR